MKCPLYKLFLQNKIIYILINSFRKMKQKLAGKCQWNKDCSLPKYQNIVSKWTWKHKILKPMEIHLLLQSSWPSQGVCPNWLFLMKLFLYFKMFYKKRITPAIPNISSTTYFKTFRLTSVHIVIIGTWIHLCNGNMKQTNFSTTSRRYNSEVELQVQMYFQ